MPAINSGLKKGFHPTNSSAAMRSIPPLRQRQRLVFKDLKALLPSHRTHTLVELKKTKSKMTTATWKVPLKTLSGNSGSQLVMTWKTYHRCLEKAPQGYRVLSGLT
jgi:hypothetical protein